MEAIRQMRQELGRENTVFVHRHAWFRFHALLLKSVQNKTTQHSVKELLSIGIQPDILLCRYRPFPGAFGE